MHINTHAYIHTHEQGSMLIRCEKMLRDANDENEALKVRLENAEKECNALRASVAGVQQQDWDSLKEAEALRIKVCV